MKVAVGHGLHAAVAAFLWTRGDRRWRPLLVTYVLVMAFTLVYTAEHYVVDILLGWALAAAVLISIRGLEAWRGRWRNADIVATRELNSV